MPDNILPYPGLRPFKRHESVIFFGRDEFTEKLTKKLSSHHFIAVVGDSGCGKSSLVRAGLFNRLATSRVGGREHWRNVLFRPGARPFTYLARAILPETKEEDKKVLRKEYIDHLQNYQQEDQEGYQKIVQKFKEKYQKEFHLNSSEDLMLMLQDSLLEETSFPHQQFENLLPSDNYSLLIVVDQFEELFRAVQAGDMEEKQLIHFVNWLLSCSYLAKSRIYVVITMRVEFLDFCATYSAKLIEAINDGFFQIPLLNKAQLRETIELPPKLMGGEVAPELVDRLLNDLQKIDVKSISDQLPLLQNALAQMWLQINQDSQQCLHLSHYIGNDLSDALNQSADEIFNNLDSRQKITTEILFRRLSFRTHEKEYIRDTASVEAIADLADVAWQAVDGIVRVFGKYNCEFLFAHHDNVKGGCTKTSVLDIRHESIIRQWKKLKSWAHEEARWAKSYRRWEDAAQQYNKGDGDLRRGRYLEATETWLQETQRLFPNTEKQLEYWSKRYGKDFDIAWDFLQKSRDAWKEEQEQERQRKITEEQRQLELENRNQALEIARLRNRWSQLSLGILFIIIIVIIGFYALLHEERNTAIQAKQQAVKEKEHAEAVEQSRTESLFESYRHHAALLMQNNDYFQAKKTLKKSYPLDDKIPAEPRHARNVLANFMAMRLAEPLKTYQGAKAVLYRTVLSADRALLVAAGENGTVVMFDKQSGILTQRFSGHGGIVWGMAFDPQQQVLATGDSHGKVILWSLDGEQVDSWETGNAITALAFDYGGKQLFTAQENQPITVWNLQGEKQGELVGSESANRLVFSPNYQYLAVAIGKSMQIWRVGQWDAPVLRWVAHNAAIQDSAFNPDGRLLATASDDSTVRIWKTSLWEKTPLRPHELVVPQATLQGHEAKVFSVMFTADGRYLVSGSADTTARVWEVESGVVARILHGHNGFVNSLLTDGDFIYTSSTDGTIKQWEVSLPAQYTLTVSDAPSAVAFSADAKQLAIGTESGTLEFRAVPGSGLLKTVDAHQDDILRLAFSADGNWLASASLDNHARVWQIEEAQLTPVITIPHQGAVNAVAFSPDSQYLLTASNDGTISGMDMTTQEILTPVVLTSPPEELNSVAWDSSGDIVLVTSNTHAGIWRRTDILEATAANKPPAPLRGYPASDATTFWAALSPDGKTVALTGRYFVVRVYPENAQEVLLQGHQDTVLRSAFSPDGKQLVTVGGDNTVKVWDLLSNSELFTIPLPVKDKNAIWDFDFQCVTEQQHCWIAVPLSPRKQVVLYDLGLLEPMRSSTIP